MATQYNPKIVTDGMVMYLDAANPMSYSRTGTTWNSLVGSGFSGSLVNGPTFNSNNAGNIVFDGTDDFVLVKPQTTISTSQFTIDCVVQENTPQDSLATFKRIVAWDDGVNTAQLLLLRNSTATPRRAFAVCRDTSGVNTNPTYVITGSDGVPTGIHHVVATFNGTTYQMYRNGLAEGNAPYSSTVIGAATASNTMFIGQRGNSIGFVSGSIYSLKIYNRALSATEVRQNYNAVSSRFGV